MIVPVHKKCANKQLYTGGTKCIFSITKEIFNYFWRNQMVVVAQLVRVAVCGAAGRRFEPGQPPGNLKP